MIFFLLHLPSSSEQLFRIPIFFHCHSLPTFSKPSSFSKPLTLPFLLLIAFQHESLGVLSSSATFSSPATRHLHYSFLHTFFVCFLTTLCLHILSSIFLQHLHFPPLHLSTSGPNTSTHLLHTFHSLSLPPSLLPPPFSPSA